MTNKQLSQLYYLGREIELEQKRIAELENMPYISDDCSASTEKLKATISSEIERCKCEHAYLSRYLERTPDARIKQLLTLRYVELKSWQQIAVKAPGLLTKDNARMSCQRYFESQESEALEAECRAWATEQYPEGAALLWKE